MIRDMEASIRLDWLAIGVVFVVVADCSGAGRLALGEEQKRSISLILTEASVEKLAQGYFFSCAAVLDNASGKKWGVHTNFYSVFDGLELVVTNAEEKLLAQQAFIFHQSPHSPSGQILRLPEGPTKGSLVFPIMDLPADAMSFKVRLVGRLPGSNYLRILSSETIEVKVTNK
jgi:hypothetical protein